MKVLKNLFRKKDNCTEKNEKTEILSNETPTKEKDIKQNNIENIKRKDSQDTEPKVKTNITWAEHSKRQTIEELEQRRLDIVQEVHRLRNTQDENGKYPTYREIASITGISRTEVGDILNGKANARYLAKRPKI